MKVGELMTGINLITARPDTPVLEARQTMLKTKIRHLLVTEEGGLLVGIVTDRDIRLNLPSQATSLSVWEINHLLTKLTVGEVMTRAVITIGPDREARDAAVLMLDHTIGALPVMDGGRLVGIVTEADILRGFVWLTGGAAGTPAPSRGRA
ncbi:MAG TPA: CBS domain-containing protein [Methylomirabilota bacterium]|jgi:acetoin utilization protein AcuB|nr:CBS domain-containing protein [Methylomirabilota bacterium]